MSASDTWWSKPRRISVVVDNPSWILPYAERLVEWCNDAGDEAVLVRDHKNMQKGDIAFYLGCMKLTPPEILVLHKRNLVVHESDLPQGKGFAPLAWQIIEGRNDIPVCLIEITQDVDAGPVVVRDVLEFEGHELSEELRNAQGEMTVSLCKRYLDAPTPPKGKPQNGKGTFYQRRYPKDSELDPHKTIAEQFNLLRIVDNERYPAFFELMGHRYEIKISKIDKK